MYNCPECQNYYALPVGYHWNGKCQNCGKFIGIELYRFLYEYKSNYISNIAMFYLPPDYYENIEEEIDLNKINISVKDQSVLYFTNDYNRLLTFYYGWLACRSIMTGYLDFRDKFINYEGVIQYN